MSSQTKFPSRASTGISGFDTILNGGFVKERTYLVHGDAGTGKTTLGFQFLFAGINQNERVLYVTLLQTRDEVEDIAESHGWSLNGLEFLELPPTVRQGEVMEQTVFHPPDVELNEVVDAILRGIEEHQPERLAIDSISELAILVNSPHQLHRQILRLKSALSEKKCTAIFIAGDMRGDLHSLLTLVHGVINLTIKRPEYGEIQRKLEIIKMRGMTYQGGIHDGRILKGGWEIYPRLKVGSQSGHTDWEQISSNIDELDQLLGGGLEKGTSCLIAGTSGAGKTMLASLYVANAAEKGTKSACFCFDERKETFRHRSESLGLNIGKYIDDETVQLNQINVGELSAGEFTHRVKQSVEENGAEIVVIDSLTGYFKAMPHEPLLANQLHELISYLGNRGVLTIMIIATQRLSNENADDIDASYIADTVIFARHFEAFGRLRRCISVLKKRHGSHEKTIRELDVSANGVELGPALTDFSGILSGHPRYEGEQRELLNKPLQPEA